MFYIVECSDRILVLTENPLNSDGQLTERFVDEYYGEDTLSAQVDIVEIQGPVDSAEFTIRTHVQPNWQRTPTFVYDPDSGKWEE